MIKHGADVNARCDESNTLGTLLFEAVRQKNEWAVKSLLEGGADLHPRDMSGRRVLYYAVRSGQESLVQMLLDHGATETAVDPVSNSGSTLLHCAMIKVNKAIVRMIVKAGIDINGQDLMGDTALHLVMLTRQQPLEEIVSLLISLGACLNIGNNDANTPLHLAVHHRQPRVVQMLLDAGAEPDLVNLLGETPLEMAQIRFTYTLDPRDEESENTLHRHSRVPPSSTVELESGLRTETENA